MTFPAPLPARWLATVAARLTLVSGVGYVAAAYTVSRFLTRPRRRAIRSSPAAIGLPFESIQIETEDSIILNGWLVEPPEPKGTVALFHGMRHNREQMLSRIEFLVAEGYRCVAIDHRAHGESGGKRISFGWYEARDVKAVARWIAERDPLQPRFALGISMGAAAICYSGPDCGWNGVILEGIYADVTATFRRRVGTFYPSWFGQFCPGIFWITQKRLKVRMQDFRPVDAVRRWHGKHVLTLTGDQDHFAPATDSQQVAAAGDTQFTLIPGAGHGNVCEAGGALYKERVLKFLAAR